jgi:hypothetical protein
MKQVYHCDELHDVKDDGGRITADFDKVQVCMAPACAKQLMLKLVEDVFEIADE